MLLHALKIEFPIFDHYLLSLLRLLLDFAKLLGIRASGVLVQCNGSIQFSLVCSSDPSIS
jgi:hypothetical protein